MGPDLSDDGDVWKWLEACATSLQGQPQAAAEAGMGDPA